MKNIYCVFIVISLYSCTGSSKLSSTTNKPNVALKSKVILKEKIPARTIITKNTDPEAVMKFAESLQGTPYLYGSSVKEKGFDCSGFINYVFNHFKIKVPRSSKDFT